MPLAARAVLDRVEQVRLAGTFVPENGHDFRVRVRVVAVEVDDAVEQVAFGGEEFGHVVAGADFVVWVAGEVVAEWVAGALQHVAGAARNRAVGQGGGHP